MHMIGKKRLVIRAEDISDMVRAYGGALPMLVVRETKDGRLIVQMMDETLALAWGAQYQKTGAVPEDFDNPSQEKPDGPIAGDQQPDAGELPLH